MAQPTTAKTAMTKNTWFDRNKWEEFNPVKGTDPKEDVAKATKKLAEWAQFYPLTVEDFMGFFGLLAEKAPYMIDMYHDPYYERASVERRALDPVTRELVICAVCLVTNCAPGLVGHGQGALAAGATEEQLMEVMFWVSYAVGKINGLGNVPGMQMTLQAAQEHGLLKPKG